MLGYRPFTLALLAGTIAVVPAASASAATTDVAASTSANWAGYVAETDSSSGDGFSRVSASWVEPTVNCSNGSGDSAFWVGLGGASSQSDALEQAGTEADCNGNGQADYYAWYELVPSAPVQLNLTISPGDHVSTTVTVNGSNVDVTVSDETTGDSSTKSLQMSDPDTSSAEWIAEAPSTCDESGNCDPLPLADFGTVNFSDASATADGQTGSISDSQWSAEPVQLQGGGVGVGAGGGYETPLFSGGSSAGAEPSSLSSNGGSFSVSWQSDSQGATSPSSSTGTTTPGGSYGYGGTGAGSGYGSSGYGSSGYGSSGYGSSGYGSSGYGYGDGGYGDGGYGYGGSGYGDGGYGGYGGYGYGDGGYGYGGYGGGYGAGYGSYGGY